MAGTSPSTEALALDLFKTIIGKDTTGRDEKQLLDLFARCLAAIRGGTAPQPIDLSDAPDEVVRFLASRPVGDDPNADLEMVPEHLLPDK